MLLVIYQIYQEQENEKEKLFMDDAISNLMPFELYMHI
jgi:hypothetical protein